MKDKEKRIIEVCDILLLNKNKKVLLQLRDNKRGVYGSGKWGIFGGKKEENETPEQCIKREMKEELDIEIATPKLLNVKRDIGEESIFKHYIFLDYIDIKAEEINIREGKQTDFFTLNDINLLNKVEWFDNLFLNIAKKVCK